MVDDFFTCDVCKVIADRFRGEKCRCEVTVKPENEFPWPEHMRSVVEPYIQWREKEAVRKALLDVGRMYLGSRSG